MLVRLIKLELDSVADRLEFVRLVQRMLTGYNLELRPGVYASEIEIWLPDFHLDTAVQLLLMHQENTTSVNVGRVMEMAARLRRETLDLDVIEDEETGQRCVSLHRI